MVGVIRNPSGSRAERFPDEPAVSPRANIDSASRQISSRSARSSPVTPCPPAPASARARKSSPPKFPDFSASASRGSPAVASAGTPGSISGPISKATLPRAPATAPEVSPPAATMRVKPCATAASVSRAKIAS